MEEQLLLLTGLSGTDINAIIRDSKLLISFCFRVVSGLTQDIPTLCTSWSHKYAELLKEHECEGNMFDVNDLEKSCAIIKEALVNPFKFSSKSGCEQKVEEQVLAMWEMVFDDLKNTGSSK